MASMMRAASTTGDGNLLSPPGWFTKADLDRFKARTRALVAQYAAYAPVPGFPINGELTLAENIADNSRLAIAYKAYRLSLGGWNAPMIHGLTGDQRHFMAGRSPGAARRAKTRQSYGSRPIPIRPFRGMLTGHTPQLTPAPINTNKHRNQQLAD